MFDVGVTDLDNVDRRVQRYLKYSVALVLLAVASPLVALAGWLMPAADLPHVWFQRSGAVTTIFSLFAGAGTASVLGGLIPRGMTGLKLEAARSIFEIKFRTIERIAFWLTIIGTVIWGYGDLIYKWSIEEFKLEKMKVLATTVVWVCSVASAASWARSSAANVPAKIPGSQLVWTDEDGSETDLIATAKLQGKWNKIAAIFASIAAVAQAISVFMN